MHLIYFLLARTAFHFLTSGEACLHRVLFWLIFLSLVLFFPFCLLRATPFSGFLLASACWLQLARFLFWWTNRIRETFIFDLLVSVSLLLCTA